MNRTSTTHETTASEKRSLRRLINAFYRAWNEGDWDACEAMVDPCLRHSGRFQSQSYRESMNKFRSAYGTVTPWYIRLSVHLSPASGNGDRRNFAYVYLVWQDNAHQFHMFKERWIKDQGRWFTRVVGLVVGKGMGEQAKSDR